MTSSTAFAEELTELEVDTLSEKMRKHAVSTYSRVPAFAHPNQIQASSGRENRFSLIQVVTMSIIRGTRLGMFDTD